MSLRTPSTEDQKRSSSGFLTEPTPQRTVFVPVADGISRAVANNPSIMTYHGTNSYLIKTTEGDFLLDPGPAEDDVHFDMLCRAMAARGAGILVTHHHSDHFGLAGLLKKRTGLPIYASEHFAGDTLVPDVMLKDGDRVADLDVLFTPGHASDHVCFARGDVLLSGDLIMGWNSSIVRGPDGNMKDYTEQLARIIENDYMLCLPGHGPALPDPRHYIERLLANRVRREKEILAMLQRNAATVAEIARVLYAKKDFRLVMAAEANVEAHLHKLRDEGKAVQEAGRWYSV